MAADRPIEDVLAHATYWVFLLVSVAVGGLFGWPWGVLTMAALVTVTIGAAWYKSGRNRAP